MARGPLADSPGSGCVESVCTLADQRLDAGVLLLVGELFPDSFFASVFVGIEKGPPLQSQMQTPLLRTFSREKSL